jgi:L-alanine-DL-glutamate epimerase-like enolase superfamily enzyme
MNTEIRVCDVQGKFETYQYRTPIKFGGIAVDRATLINVKVTVEDRQGRRQDGYGSMPLGNVWAYPSKTMTHDQTLLVMKSIAVKAGRLCRTESVWGHPVEIGDALEETALDHAREFPGIFVEGHPALDLPLIDDPVPALATLVALSPVDGAIHDAYGRLHGLSCYETYGRDFLPRDVGSFLGDTFRDVWLNQHISSTPVAKLPLYHLVGALDPLTPADVKRPIDDGYPEHLQEWIKRDSLTHLKIKLNGDHLDWDVDRVAAIEAASAEVQTERGCGRWNYSLDFNERCRDVQYLLEFIRRLQELAPRAFGRVQYIEQPTARDLKAHPENKMHAVSKLLPVVIDESLIDVESLLLAREQGYTGVALKACKGQSSSLLLAAAARHLGMFLCVQDLTCPGASLVHSAGLAAHVKGVAAIEANARQYLPAANEGWKQRYPGLFEPIEGCLLTGQLTGPGLSFDERFLPF